MIEFEYKLYKIGTLKTWITGPPRCFLPSSPLLVLLAAALALPGLALSRNRLSKTIAKKQYIVYHVFVIIMSRIPTNIWQCSHSCSHDNSSISSQNSTDCELDLSSAQFANVGSNLENSFLTPPNYVNANISFTFRWPPSSTLVVL